MARQRRFLGELRRDDERRESLAATACIKKGRVSFEGIGEEVNYLFADEEGEG